MGNNSVFDDLGFGASDLGLAPDPDVIKREQANALEQQRRDREAEKTRLENEKKAEEERVRQEEANAAEQSRKEAEAAAEGKRTRARSSTVLTSGQGADEENLNISRRTLLGS